VEVVVTEAVVNKVDVSVIVVGAAATVTKIKEVSSVTVVVKGPSGPFRLAMARRTSRSIWTARLPLDLWLSDFGATELQLAVLVVMVVAVVVAFVMAVLVMVLVVVLVTGRG
jgi:hypothetical protein